MIVIKKLLSSLLICLALSPVAFASESILIQLASDNQWKEIMNLVRQGANAKETDSKGRSLLMYCAKMSYPDSLKELIEHGADVNKKDHTGQTALFWAVKSGQYEQVFNLALAGADVNVKDHQGGAAIDYALQWNDAETALTLLALKAVPHEKNYSKLSQLLIDSTERPLIKASLFILKYKINVNEQDKTSKTALMYAAEKGILQVVTAIINAGADVNAKDHSGRTALGYAVKGIVSVDDMKDHLQILFNDTYESDYKGVIKALRKAGAKANNEMMDYLVDKEGEKKSFWDYYLRSQLYYWEIILFYLGIVLTMILVFRQFEKWVDWVAILFSFLIGIIATIGLIGNYIPEFQFLLTTTKVGNILFALLRALIVTALAFSCIYLIWQLTETTTQKNECVIDVDDVLCCTYCGKTITLTDRSKGFCPFCKRRFEAMESELEEPED